MLTGDIRNQIDRIWDAFWSGGISNSLEVIEQITYLLFLRRLDDLQTLEENKSLGWGGLSSAASSPRATTRAVSPMSSSAGRASSTPRRVRCSLSSANTSFHFCAPLVATTPPT